MPQTTQEVANLANRRTHFVVPDIGGVSTGVLFVQCLHSWEIARKLARFGIYVMDGVDDNAD